MKDERSETAPGIEEKEEIEPPGAWLFAMLADLRIGPTSDEIERENDEK